MRKALMGLILAATAMTPVAASAQNETQDVDRQNSRAAHYERLEQRNQERYTPRAERQPAPQARAVEQPQVVQPQVVQPQVVERQRGNWQRGNDGQRGSWGGRQRDEQVVQQQQQQQVERQRGNWQRGGDGQRGNWSGRQGGEQVVQEQQVQRQRGDWQRSGDGQRQSAYPEGWQGNPNDPARQRYERLERRNQYRYGTQQQRQDVRREWQQRGDTRYGGNDRDWSRNWDRSSWRNDRRYDWRSWRYSNRNLFRSSAYYSPYRNWGYSRFSVGVFLEPLFYSQQYWIGDPWQYRLPYAPPGTQWVRYYNDVLLVDTWSGEVVDVIYDFFW